MPIQTGPYLIAALICEKVLEEKDGVKSAIRMIDRITKRVTGPDPPQTMEPFIQNLFLLIRFKSGQARGVYPLRIVFVKPSGESPPPLEISINFEGEEDRGADIIANMQTQFEMQGIHWFEIFLKNDFLTRIPVRVIYIPQITQMRG